MSGVTVRAMTEDEYPKWQETLAERFAHEQVAAGNWAEEGAIEKARATNARLLPDGLSTPRMLIMTAVDDTGATVGRIWIGLDHPRGTPNSGFLYDIEIDAEHRGRGLGKELLAAVEDAVREAGIFTLDLNVFTRNRAAVALYESSGYVVTTQQMCKQL